MSSSSGFIPWIIKKDAFRKFHNCKIGDYLVSEEVTKQGLTFYMKCYPNGSKHKFEGWTGLSLTLKKTSIPSNISNIFVRYYLYESQTSSVARGIARFSNNDIIFSHQENKQKDNDHNMKPPPIHKRRNSFIDLMIGDNSSKDEPKSKSLSSSSGYAKANGTNYLCPLESLKKYDVVSLVCEFEIVRMYKLSQLISGAPLKLNKIIKYEWDITNKNLDKFRLCNNAYTRLYSEEFNIYNLVIVPSATTYTSKGNISLRLRLHELPPIIKSINIILTLSCKQFDKHWTSILTLSYDQPWVSWPSSTLKKSQVDERLDSDESMTSIKFQCYIEVLNINLHNLIITESDDKYKDVWNKFVQDDNNIFMRENGSNSLIQNATKKTQKVNPLQRRKNAIITDPNDDNDDDQNKDDIKEEKHNGYDHRMDDNKDDNDNEEDDQYEMYKKEDMIRMEILKSLDLNDIQQKQYLMNKLHGMSENIRILKKEKYQSTKVIQELQSTIESMPENMFSCLNLQLNSALKMGAGSSGGMMDDGDEKNAHKVLVIRTKDSSGYLLIGANKQGGYYHSKKYVSFSHSEKENITIALSLWDTPAIDFSANVHDQVTSPYYQYAHGLFCVYNVESIESFTQMCDKISYFYKNPQKTPFKDVSKVAIMLIGHKTKHFSESMRRVPQEKAIKYANAMDITFFEVSSANWQDMSDLYTIMGKSIYQIYGELPLKTRQNMTEMLDVNDRDIIRNIGPTPKLKPKSPSSMEDEKVNDVISESENSLSELSDLELDENNQPTKTPSVAQGSFKRSKKDTTKEKEKRTKSRKSDELPSRHRSSHEHRPSSERRHKESIECNPVSMRFKEFIDERVQMPYLYELFSAQHYDDIRMIEYFDEDMLKNEIGIKNLIHRKLFLQQCTDLKYEIEQFRKWLVDRLQLRRYLPVFEANGLITMSHITKEINSQSDFELKLKIVNRNHQQVLWQELQTYESAINDSDYAKSNPNLTINVTQYNNDDNKSQSGSRPSTPNKATTPKRKTKMSSAYANIQRNKQIFNSITKNNQYKMDTNRKMAGGKSGNFSKSTRDLESMMTDVQLQSIDDSKPTNSWKRSSSLTSTLSDNGGSTPRGTSPSGTQTQKKLAPKKPIKKRRKSFSLGMSSY